MDLILYFVFNIPKKTAEAITATENRDIKTNSNNEWDESLIWNYSFLSSEFYFGVWRLNLQEIREREQKLKLI